MAGAEEEFVSEFPDDWILDDDAQQQGEEVEAEPDVELEEEEEPVAEVVVEEDEEDVEPAAEAAAEEEVMEDAEAEEAENPLESVEGEADSGLVEVAVGEDEVEVEEEEAVAAPATPPAGGARANPSPRGVKRPAEVLDASRRRPGAAVALPTQGEEKPLPPPVAAKVKLLGSRGVRLAAPALRMLAAAPQSSALITLLALLNRKTVGDPSRWVIATLQKRLPAGQQPVARAPGGAAPLTARAPVVKSPAVKPWFAKANVTIVKAPPGAAKAPALGKMPVGKVPVGKVPVGKVPVGKVPVGKVPVGKVPVGKVPVGKVPLAKVPVVKKLALQVPVPTTPPAAGPSPGAKAPVAKRPVAKAPVAKVPVAKVPVAKVPVAKVPVTKQPAGSAKAPVAKVPVVKAKQPVAKAPRTAPLTGRKQPPRQRTGLDFDQMAVQGKLLALNKQSVWEGQHPLDEAALAALLKINTGRAMEILDEAEERSKELPEPTLFVLQAVQEQLAEDAADAEEAEVAAAAG